MADQSFFAQEGEHFTQHGGGEGHPQEALDGPTSKENRPAFPARLGSHCKEPEGRHDQGRNGCHPQAIQKESESPESGHQGLARKLDVPKFLLQLLISMFLHNSKTMSWISPTWLASNGTQRSRELGWSSTFRATAAWHPHQTRRRTRRRTKSKVSPSRDLCP